MKKRHVVIDLGSVADGESSAVADLGSMGAVLFFIKTGSGSARTFCIEASPDGEDETFGRCGNRSVSQSASLQRVHPITWEFSTFTTSWTAGSFYAPRYLRVTSISGAIDSVIVDAQRFIE